ncbi:MAG: hypothetical protein RLZZ196_3073 [Bacteroidota bacterium]
MEANQLYIKKTNIHNWLVPNELFLKIVAKIFFLLKKFAYIYIIIKQGIFIVTMQNISLHINLWSTRQFCSPLAISNRFDVSKQGYTKVPRQVYDYGSRG